MPRISEPRADDPPPPYAFPSRRPRLPGMDLRSSNYVLYGLIPFRGKQRIDVCLGGGVAQPLVIVNDLADSTAFLGFEVRLLNRGADLSDGGPYGGGWNEALFNLEEGKKIRVRTKRMH